MPRRLNGNWATGFPAHFKVMGGQGRREEAIIREVLVGDSRRPCSTSLRFW